MDCAFVASHLVAYQFGAVTDDERDALDEHLVACTACLKTYLALKRAADARPKELPSPAAKAKLRAAVAEAFPPPSRVTPLLRRRIPLYQGVAFAAVAAAVALLAPSVVKRVVPADVGVGAPDVDTSRPRPASLEIY